MIYRVEHRSLNNGSEHEISTVQQFDIYNNIDDAKREFLYLIEELTRVPECDAWNMENMPNGELNEDLCCGKCDMCGVVYTNNEYDISTYDSHNSENNYLLYFRNDEHEIFIEKMNPNQSIIP